MNPTTTYTVRIDYPNGMETLRIVYKPDDKQPDYLDVIQEAARIIRRKQKASGNYNRVRGITIETVARDY